MVGTVNNVVASKRFGFILGENNQEYFFHASDVLGSWDELEMMFERYGKGRVKVTFEPIKTEKGPRARGVTLFLDKEDREDQEFSTMFSVQELYCCICRIIYQTTCNSGTKWSNGVCSMRCHNEKEWRYTLSVMNKPYREDPRQYDVNGYPIQ